MQDTTLAETYWRSLRYFNYYRLAVGLLLIVFQTVPLVSSGLFDPLHRSLFLGACIGSVLLASFSLILLGQLRQRFNLQLSFQVLTDIVVYVLLIHASGGLRGGLGMLLLVSLAAAGLVGQGRLVLFYAALASIAVLLQQLYEALNLAEFDAAAMLQAGILCVGFFATAASARLLASRVVANEELARRRGADLQRQMHVSERVIAQMQDGVLVVGGGGELLQANPRARAFLGFAPPADGTTGQRLSSVAPNLAQGYTLWQRGGADEAWEFRAPVGGHLLRARFLPIVGDSQDTLVFLDDVGKQRAQAQQLKLAALGRLTANIAHEIRNPLSAIQHSAELLLESTHDPAEARLLRIMIDNTHRLERIVSDVLQIGRRDRIQRDAIDLRTYLPAFAEEFCTKSRVAAETVSCEIADAAVLDFDRSHLHQVLWNLFDNALRHGRQQAGSLRVWVDGEPGAIQVHIADDGDGVPAAMRTQVFEPFFTTHAAGTGLGLYMARELCEANGARLELMDNAPGAHFCVVGG